MVKHYISLDSQKLQSKPDNSMVGGIVNRLGSEDTDIEVKIDELIDYLIVPNGQSWSPATYTGIKDHDHWNSQGYFALDFDYEDPEKDQGKIKSKKDIFGDKYVPNPTWEQVIEKCEKYGVLPCAVHSSFTSVNSNKYRVIFQLSTTVTNPKIAKSILYLLFVLFPQSDIQCATDISRFFYGGKELLWSGYNNVLDPVALFGGVSKTINEEYPENKEVIKQHILMNCQLSGLKELDLKEFQSLSDSEKINVFSMNKDNKFSFVYFIFDQQIIDKMTTEDMKRPPSYTVMDDYDKQRVETALSFIDPNDYDVWYKVGMALKQTFGDSAKDLWKVWSRRADNADEESALDKKWEKGLKPNGSLTVGTVYELARQNGWDPIPETVKKFNKDFFMVRESGNVVIYEEKIEEERNYFNKRIKALNLIKNTPQALKQWYAGDNVKLVKNGNDFWENKAKYWLEHPKRRKIEKIVFSPKRNVGPSVYNLWKGFAVDYVDPKDFNPKKCDIYIKHIKEVVAAGDRRLADYVFGWMAHAVQFPDRLPEVALVIRGGQGSGKSLFVEIFGQIFGQHYLCIKSEEALTGRFNSHLRDKILVFADEAFWKGNHAAKNKLKGYITAPKLDIEQKQKDMTSFDNYMHIIMASNDRTIVPVEHDDRRYCLIEMSDHRIGDKKYFADMVKQMNEDGGIEHFLCYLKNLNLDNFEIDKFPKTKLHLDHKLDEITRTEYGFIYKILGNGKLYEHADEWGHVKPSVLYDEYLKYLQRHNPGKAYPMNNIAFGKFLFNFFGSCVKRSRGNVVEYDKVTKNKTVRLENTYMFLPLKYCRQKFEEYLGQEVDWDESLDSEILSDPLPAAPESLSYEDRVLDNIQDDELRSVYENVFGDRKETGTTLIKFDDGTEISF